MTVVRLEFKSPHVADDTMSFVACRHCRNKTFTLTDDRGDFPLMRCAACGAHIGRMGWAHDDDPLNEPPKPQGEVKPFPPPPGRL